MKNKVLIKLIVPELDQEFDIFIPVNELVWKIKRLLLKSISDLSNVNLDQSLEYILMNKDTSEIYDNNVLVINTNIRNGSELFLFSKYKTIMDYGL